MDAIIQPVHRLRGEISVPGDKSISHRSVIIGSIAEGRTEITGFLRAQDCLATLTCMRHLGAAIDYNPEHQRVTIEGKGLESLQEPVNILDAGNSGTTARLLLGLLSGQQFFSVITGDESLRQRPMDRITTPLRVMGAKLQGRGSGKWLPISIQGSKLQGAKHFLKVASAQTKSALLLAGLYANGFTEVLQPIPTRDHTERLLQAFGAQIEKRSDSVTVVGGCRLRGQKIEIPGDISSAAFFMVAGCLVPNSEIIIRNLGVNPTRTGILQLLQSMGAEIELLNCRQELEPSGDIVVRSAPLKAIDITSDMVPDLIDELPVIAVAACLAEGTTTIRGALELRVKESDRLAAISSQLSRLGAKIEELEDGLIIEGPSHLHGGKVQSFGDHRIAMALAIAGMVSRYPVTIEGAEAVNISFPDFFSALDSLRE